MKEKTVDFIAAALLAFLAIDAVTFGQPPSAEDRVFTINEKQGNATISAEVYDKLNPDNISIKIFLTEQRARVYAGDELAIDTPISTGRKGHETPTGKFTITEKKRHHRSSLYGDFVDRKGRVVKSGVTPGSRRPAGTTFRGTSVPYWQRLTDGGIGMHAGHLPGEPASHGCLRFPPDVIPLMFAKTAIGTAVVIEK